ncbi:hypothetical protein CXG81DRAFT_19770 [Caulochytrium protostelioides]|uniref:RCC1/BLIP-II n=1 Tax=Caulochytrium protostelioides TaxID=1555241 RepID=A0A4P9X582_9FUNG|nr:hypothetical protein CXG81DRAFT_19770 [Caulochytrium protostelioides]|eukprot:RKP00242.1 hypothetical protein CXG81DRAFT_19770 [Caulochytrium protostelioides]
MLGVQAAARGLRAAGAAPASLARHAAPLPRAWRLPSARVMPLRWQSASSHPSPPPPPPSSSSSSSSPSSASSPSSSSSSSSPSSASSPSPSPTLGKPISAPQYRRGETPVPNAISHEHPRFAPRSSNARRAGFLLAACVLTGVSVYAARSPTLFAHADAPASTAARSDAAAAAPPTFAAHAPVDGRPVVAPAQEDARATPYVAVAGMDGVPAGKAAYVPELEGLALRDLAVTARHLHAIDHRGELLLWQPSDHPGIVRVRLSGYDLVQLAVSASELFALSRTGAIYRLPLDIDAPAFVPAAPAAAAAVDAAGAAQLPAISYDPLTDKTAVRLRFVAVAAGAHHLAAVDVAGAVHTLCLDATGNDRGQAGHTDTDRFQRVELQSTDPIARIADPLAVTDIACGMAHTLARTRCGRVFGWGDNTFGQLGQGPSAAATAATVAVPTEIRSIWKARRLMSRPVDATCVAIAAGGPAANTSFFVVDRAADTTLMACGASQYGQCGTGAYQHALAWPQPVRGVSGLAEYDEATGAMVPIRVRHVATSGTHTACALATNTDVAVVAPPSASRTWLSQAGRAGLLLVMPWRWFGATGRAAVRHDADTLARDGCGSDVLVCGLNLQGQLCREDGRRRQSSPTPVPMGSLSPSAPDIAARMIQRPGMPVAAGLSGRSSGDGGLAGATVGGAVPPGVVDEDDEDDDVAPASIATRVVTPAASRTPEDVDADADAADATAAGMAIPATPTRMQLHGPARVVVRDGTTVCAAQQICVAPGVTAVYARVIDP